MVELLLVFMDFYFKSEQDYKELIEVDCRLFNDRPFQWAGCQCYGILPVLTVGCTLVAVSALKSVKESDSDFIMNVLQNEKCTDVFLM